MRQVANTKFWRLERFERYREQRFKRGRQHLLVSMEILLLPHAPLESLVPMAKFIQTFTSFPRELRMEVYTVYVRDSLKRAIFREMDGMVQWRRNGTVFTLYSFSLDVLDIYYTQRRKCDQSI